MSKKKTLIRTNGKERLTRNTFRRVVRQSALDKGEERIRNMIPYLGIKALKHSYPEHIKASLIQRCHNPNHILL